MSHYVKVSLTEPAREALRHAQIHLSAHLDRRLSLSETLVELEVLRQNESYCHSNPTVRLEELLASEELA